MNYCHTNFYFTTFSHFNSSLLKLINKLISLFNSLTSFNLTFEYLIRIEPVLLPVKVFKNME